MGQIGDKNTENEVLLLEHDIPHSRFSDVVNNCLPKLPWIITDEVRRLIYSISSMVRTLFKLNEICKLFE